MVFPKTVFLALLLTLGAPFAQAADASSEMTVSECASQVATYLEKGLMTTLDLRLIWLKLHDPVGFGDEIRDADVGRVNFILHAGNSFRVILLGGEPGQSDLRKTPPDIRTGDIIFGRARDDAYDHSGSFHIVSSYDPTTYVSTGTLFLEQSCTLTPNAALPLTLMRPDAPVIRAKPGLLALRVIDTRICQ